MSEKYATTLLMHLNLGSKGSTRVMELDKYPGVTITESWDKPAKKVTRDVIYGNSSFKTIFDAVEAWKAANGKS